MHNANAVNENTNSSLGKQLSLIQLVTRYFLLASICSQTKVCFSRQSANCLLSSGIVAAGFGPAQIGADLVGRNKLLVLIDNRSTKGTLLYDDRGEDESRPNLDEVDLEVAASWGGLLILLLLAVLTVALGIKEGTLGLADLVVSNPDFAINNTESHYMVNERLGFSSPLGNAECVEEQFFDNPEMRLRVEGGIEGEERSRALQAVASEV